MKKLILLIICGTFFWSCDQISKSINETFKPGDTLVNKDKEKPASGNNQPDVQTMINSAIEKHTTVQTQIHVENENINFLTDTKALEKAEESLRKLPQYAGKEIFVYSIAYFYDDGSINIMLQHPTNPKYVDGYDYKDNKWSEPRPIQLSVKDDVQKRLVPLNKIRFENVAKLTAIYNKKAQEIEGAKPLTSAYVSIWGNEMQWYPTSISGSREKYLIQFNNDGTLKSFKQD
ncbi:hypothetical protein [Flavobacterium sp.]|uniref:hypothetical protein n=1 Tax=Flavobacterium sp. TaxID=239 RepID=UPI003D0EB48F